MGLFNRVSIRRRFAKGPLHACRRTIGGGQYARSPGVSVWFDVTPVAVTEAVNGVRDFWSELQR